LNDDDLEGAEREPAAAPRTRDAADWRLGVVSFAGAWFLRGLAATLRREHHGDAQMRDWERRGRHFILAFWHQRMLLMPWAYRGRRMAVLSSLSRDGELMVRTLARLGIETARGSSTRGGAAGLRGLLRKAREGCDLGFTPDGPRGPAGEVKPGVLLAAAASGLPIIPVAYEASRCRRLKSWDRQVVPMPFARLVYAYGEAMEVPRRVDLDAAAIELKQRIDEVEARAAAILSAG
jgi:lysophospholipid acyltransferase (LPLAT)-like uncharacterized protein